MSTHGSRLTKRAAFDAAIAAVECGATLRPGSTKQRGVVVLERVAPRCYGRLLDTGWLPRWEVTTWTYWLTGGAL